MITFLNGILVKKQPTRLEVDVSGVGYELLIPVSSYDKLPPTGEKLNILTYDYVREDQHHLFGFMTEDERSMFVLLMSVSGIGPKLAMSALSGLSVRNIKAAIANGDAKKLSSISGVGKKMAERIVVELKDRIEPADGLAASLGLSDGSEGQIKMRDAVMALMSLGYKQVSAEKMVADVATKAGASEFSVEDMIRKALSKQD